MIQKSIKQMGLLKNAQSSGPTEESVTCVFCETKITSISALRNHVLNEHKPSEDDKSKVNDDLSPQRPLHVIFLQLNASFWNSAIQFRVPCSR